MKIMKHIIALMVGLVALGAQAQTGNWDDFRASKFSQQSNMLKTIGIQNEAELALLSYAINHDEPNINGYTINLARDLDMSAHWFTPIGSTDAHAFKGVFDGNGYQINIKIDDKGAFAGLFRHISNASVRHLKLTGSVTGGIHSAGLIGHTLSGTNNHTDDCLVSVQVTCSDNGVTAPHGGGLWLSVQRYHHGSRYEGGRQKACRSYHRMEQHPRQSAHHRLRGDGQLQRLRR